MKTGVFKQGMVLLDEGEIGQVFRFIKTGLVLLRQRGPDGLDRSLGLVGRGFVTGQMGVYGQPSMMRFEAVGTVSVCEVEHATLRRLGVLHGEGTAALVAFNIKAIEALSGWSQIMRERHVSARLGAALVLMVRDQGSPRILLPGQRVLAELLAVTRESVGRSLDELGTLGLVTRLGRGAMEVDVDALRGWFVSKNSG